MLRFYRPLIEPDVRICRIRLSDEGPSRLRTRRVGPPGQADETEVSVQDVVRVVPVAATCQLVLATQPPPEPPAHVPIHALVGLRHRAKTEVVRPPHQLL